MDYERPPDIDVEYRVIRGPWSRWTLQLSLLKLALRAAGVVALLLIAAALIAVVVLARR
jgi:hypothetical protein